MVQGITMQKEQVEFAEEEEIDDQQWIPKGMHTFKTSLATRLAQDAPKRMGMDLVLKEYQPFAKVFDEPSSRRFPKACPWDHAIDLKPNAKPYAGKVYSLDNCQDPLLRGKSRKSEDVRDLPTGRKGSLMIPNKFRNTRREVRVI